MSSEPTVLVTGPTGFVGAHVFSTLLNAGYRVKGTIRSQSKARYLENKFAKFADSFSSVVVPDLQAAGALDDAVQDVDYIAHIASPFFANTERPIEDLVNPAMNGTKNVLASAMKAPKLKRLIVLSSFAAVNDLGKSPRPGYTYTEKDWNPVTEEQAASSGGLGYVASKTFAERAAWITWKEAKDAGRVSWDLVTLNPPMIYGPPLHEVDVSKGIAGLNTSTSRLLLGITGTDPNFAPKVSTPGLVAWVDVRNIAEAHLKSIMLPAGVSERFLISNDEAYIEDGLAKLRSQNAPGLGEEGAKIDHKNHFIVDGSKAKRELGLQYIPFERTIGDVYAWGREMGLIKV